ncbi:beta-ketoacyl synthase N-terminal-like domain-containing protein [Chryseobacterium sp. c4a]|uniref:beta-ketoacyl synthase N-terminal-like domain-containing protein n=1 Tax=Chryseobacterium sp. c4a TaxID=1573582 RepID=UPI001359FA9C|nr:beta-ketoacyl synthase N-terminal-like domain-containing protein [Chryseobacterium sp. c4a]
MKTTKRHEIVVTGIGITSAIGQGKSAFFENLLQGRSAFRVMEREGRQKGTAFIGAEMQELILPERFSKRLIRNTSLSAKAALVTLAEAWEEANLQDLDPYNIGLVIGGSNFQQRELLQTFESFNNKLPYLKPNYALSFMDTDVCGMCTEQFGIKGRAYSVGGASASGQMALIQAIEAVQSGSLKVCIAIGALMDLSYMELQAFKVANAMGSEVFKNEPQMACRPFDKKHDGFIYGECCGAIVVESKAHAQERSQDSYAQFTGWSIAMDANRNPNPSYEGELHVIKDALKMAKLKAENIDYVSPHGTGSPLGDETELKAFIESGLSEACINTTKSIIGHGLSAAGLVEMIALLLQMKEGQLHPSLNLEDPINTHMKWVKEKAIPCSIKNALKLSYGFGGINTAVCVQKIESKKLKS